MILGEDGGGDWIGGAFKMPDEVNVDGVIAESTGGAFKMPDNVSVDDVVAESTGNNPLTHAASTNFPSSVRRGVVGTITPLSAKLFNALDEMGPTLSNDALR